MRYLTRLSTRWKLILGCCLVEGIMLTFLVGNSLRLTEESLGLQVETRLKEVSSLLNASIAPAMARRDQAALGRIFAAMRNQEGIQYFVLWDKNGQILASDGWDKALPLPAPDHQIAPGKGDGRLDHRIPIALSKQEYGQLQFGIPTGFIQQARTHLMRQSMAIGTLATVLSALLLTVFVLWTTRHLQRLTRASRAIAQGRLDVHVPVPADSEIGALATAFNTMAAKIQEQMEDLRHSEARYHQLLDLSTDWYWEQDTAFRFTRYESGRGTSTDGPDLSCFLGKARWELESPLAPEEWALHRAMLEQHQTFRNFEFSVFLPDGSLRHLITHGEPVFTDAGDFSGYRGTTKDITAHRQAEASLRLAASVFAETHEAIIIADPQRRIIDANPAYTKVTGYPKASILGRSLEELYIEKDQLDVHALWDKLDNQGVWRGEIESRRQDHSALTALVNMTAVRDQHGAVSHHIVIFSDITPLKAHRDELQRLAHHDALTQLPNRILLADRLEQGLAQIKRSHQVLAVAYLDLDGFKPVNDTLGHAAGDQVLKEVAKRLRACLRAADTVARLGGDEFVLLIHAEDVGECEAALLRILDQLALPYDIAGHSPALSASIGVTLAPHDPSDPDGLLRHADQAMYVAKQSGKNRYHLFDAHHERLVQARREQLSRIQSALLAEEFVLHYQPKVNMASGEVTGAEALIRWQHPERGLLPPDQFLPFIEDSDFIVTLGNWVIEQALAQMAQWHRQGLKLPVSVNLSPRQFEAENFTARLKELLTTQPTVPPHWLELEIVESAALDDVQAVAATVNECRALGVSFALDDFGTGYSSLTYLRHLPIQTLKIDRSFVHDMLSDPEDRAVVDGIIGLARAFDLEIIAEGVESLEHGHALMELGCFHAQGFAIAAALPAERMAEWVTQYSNAPVWQEGEQDVLP